MVGWCSMGTLMTHNLSAVPLPQKIYLAPLYQAPERLYQGGNCFVEFFGMSWRRGPQFLGGRSWSWRPMKWMGSSWQIHGNYMETIWELYGKLGIIWEIGNYMGHFHDNFYGNWWFHDWGQFSWEVFMEMFITNWWEFIMTRVLRTMGNHEKENYKGKNMGIVKSLYLRINH